MHLGLLGGCLGTDCGIWHGCGDAAYQQSRADTDCHLHQSFGNQGSPLYPRLLKQRRHFRAINVFHYQSTRTIKTRQINTFDRFFHVVWRICCGFGNTWAYQPPYSRSSVLLPLRPLICQAVRSPIKRARYSSSSSVWLMARAGVNAARPSKRGSAHMAWW